MIMVPNVLPAVPVPARAPVVLFMSDKFTKPNPVQADLVFDIDAVIDKKLDAITSHRSQVEEWLPWIDGYDDEVPAGEEARRSYVRARAGQGPAAQADRFRHALAARYGETRGHEVRNAEAYEVSEYGAPLSAELARSLFPY
jgi:hypothetical protein